MTGWHYDSALEAFYMSDWLYVVMAIVMVVLGIAAAVWFIDGIIKFGYWWSKDKEEE